MTTLYLLIKMKFTKFNWILGRFLLLVWSGIFPNIGYRVLLSTLMKNLLMDSFLPWSLLPEHWFWLFLYRITPYNCKWITWIKCYNDKRLVFLFNWLMKYLIVLLVLKYIQREIWKMRTIAFKSENQTYKRSFFWKNMDYLNMC